MVPALLCHCGCAERAGCVLHETGVTNQDRCRCACRNAWMRGSLIALVCVAVSVGAEQWTLVGAGMHRTATWAARIRGTELGGGGGPTLRVNISVPADFYVDINELPKRSHLKASAVSPSYCEWSYRFDRSAASAPIDIEGPSFRSATVPSRTSVALTFALVDRPTCREATGDAEIALLLSFPVHARYGAPVNVPPAPGQSLIAAFFAEHYRNVPFAFEVTAATRGDGSGTPITLVSGPLAVPTWRIPVANAAFTPFVFTTTMTIIVGAAVVTSLVALHGVPGAPRPANSQRKRE